MKDTLEVMSDIIEGRSQNQYSNIDFAKLKSFFLSFDSSTIWDCSFKFKNKDGRFYGYGILNKELLNKSNLFNVGELYISLDRIVTIKDIGFDQFVAILNDGVEFWFQPEG